MYCISFLVVVGFFYFLLLSIFYHFVFHVYNVLFGETSFSTDNEIVIFIMLYKKQYIYLCLKQKNSIFLWAYTFFWSMPQFKKLQCSIFEIWWSTWKDIFMFDPEDRVFNSMKTYHIFMLKYILVWMKVWNKSANIKNNSNMCYMYLAYVYCKFKAHF